MSNRLDKLTEYFNRRGDLVLLESQSDEHRSSKVSYLAALPKATITAYGDEITIKAGKEKKQFRENPWRALQDFRSQHDDWMFGYFGYDLKNYIEQLESINPDPVGAPDMYFMVPEFLLKTDQAEHSFEVIRGDLPDDLPGGTMDISPASVTNLISSTDRECYIDKISEAQQLISEGEFYEINLSHQLSGDFSGSPFDLYKRMRRVGPVPFGSFIRWDDREICSASPERFLCRTGSQVYSQPIKGTARRSDNPETDRQHREQLMQSRKEQAENLMIVDLVRNDLSKIAREGSVRVPELFEIQSFGTVHQMVSTITAVAGVDDPVEIIKACFPMGSMTGAPKISAMKSIDTLENYRRGIYSGAVGYIKPDGDFDFNVVIRTAVISSGRLYYSVGGAITSDSDPASEWEETMIKAKALVLPLRH